jgi:UDP-N-acetyl-2-amino-2-deoxyglucuronate dehydrogenase
MEKIPTFMLIGSGFIMPRHADAIHSVGGKILEIVNTAHYGHEWERKLIQSRAHYVSILTPNHLHAEIAARAIFENKTVLSEKPLGISSQEIARLIDEEKKGARIFTVLQLRHHPLVKKLKQQIDLAREYEVTLDISVYRDAAYYSGWKGNAAQSGGILFNLGSHYFDLITYLFGMPEKVTSVEGDEKTMQGILEGKNFHCDWRISTDAPRDDQKRIFRLNGHNCNFSSKDNLSYENLHYYVYKDLIEGKGALPSEVLPSTFLIESIYDAFKKRRTI